MILIDTHVLLWWIGDRKKLSLKATKIFSEQSQQGLIFVSSISIWEICLLLKKKKISLLMDTESWIEQIEKLPYIQFVPVDNRIAAKSVNLPGQFHSDPADRIIVATAREMGAVLVTSDDKIRKYPHIQTIW
ncbi:type II toxin-antitoxin system VapC family toxin [Candidatus Daviesbacteria bacterium]|nr:type II toxin-antitoxin system VapC family toxin [Candidatus Daviesbacteria bacterium]